VPRDPSGGAPYVVAAPDKFRGTATAREVAAAIAAAVEQAGGTCVQRAMADGGEGLLDVFGGADRSTRVTGPNGAVVEAGWRLDPDGRAVIESALASGLMLAGGAERNDPVAATSRGTGELIAAALEAGATRVMVGLGGSATTDGGRGAVEALSAAGGIPRTCEVLVCCDVRTTYLDAARVFGPQKGATPDDVRLLTDRLRDDARWLRTTYGVDVTSLPGSGAAGGLAGGLAALGARLVDGFDHVADELGLDDALQQASLVVTGEGTLDATSFDGKVVGGIHRRARARGIPVLVVAGRIDGVPPPDVTAVSLSRAYGEEASMTRTLACVRDAVSAYLRET
jgi:glycerate 2-kinase